jgi:hypothetical protein
MFLPVLLFVFGDVSMKNNVIIFNGSFTCIVCLSDGRLKASSTAFSQWRARRSASAFVLSVDDLKFKPE